jgi:NADPH-dependent ferric siderophore reductase
MLSQELKAVRFEVTAKRTQMLTPRMKRITVDGRQLADFHNGQPAQWVKVFPPARSSASSIGRAYTIRRFDRISHDLDIDFALHGDSGPVSAFALRAEVGDTFEVSLPHPRSGFEIDVSTKHYLLIGDETALPAIGSIVEALPTYAKARVFIEVAGAAEEQTLRCPGSLDLSWIHRDAAIPNSTGLANRVVSEMVRPQSLTQVWVAGESAAVEVVRRHLLHLGYPQERLRAVGYWKRGQSAYRDREGAP